MNRNMFKKLVEERYDTDLFNEVNLKYRQVSMWPDFFACTFYSMITKHKDRFGVLDEEVSEYYFESLFILLM